MKNDIINYKALGKRIKEKRETADISCNDLAEAVGLTAAQLSNIECGAAKVSLLTLTRIANKLKTSMDELILDSYTNTKLISIIEIKSVLEQCGDNERQVLEWALETLSRIIHISGD